MATPMPTPGPQGYISYHPNPTPVSKSPYASKHSYTIIAHIPIIQLHTTNSTNSAGALYDCFTSSGTDKDIASAVSESVGTRIRARFPHAFKTQFVQQEPAFEVMGNGLWVRVEWVVRGYQRMLVGEAAGRGWGRSLVWWLGGRFEGMLGKRLL